MNLLWTILTTALIFFLTQLILFLLLFAHWTIQLILSLFCFGAVLKDSAVQAFISKILNALLYPINQIMPASSTHSFATPLLLGLDSLVWGVVIGTVIYLVWKLSEKFKAAK